MICICFTVQMLHPSPPISVAAVKLEWLAILLTEVCPWLVVRLSGR